MTPSDLARLDAQLDSLHLSHVKSHYQDLANAAAHKQLPHLAYLAELIEGEATLRENRAIERRIKNARFPVLKTMADFQWSWPKKINRPQIQNLFRLAFIADNTNVVFISTVGLGKTHISLAIGRAACIGGHSVLCAGSAPSSLCLSHRPNRAGKETMVGLPCRRQTRERSGDCRRRQVHARGDKNDLLSSISTDPTIANVDQRIADGEDRIARIKRLVARLQKSNFDTSAAEQLLVTMSASIALMFDHRRLLTSDRWRRATPSGDKR